MIDHLLNIKTMKKVFAYFAIIFVLITALFTKQTNGQTVFFDQFGQTAVNPIASSGDPDVDYTIWTTVTPVTAQAGTAEIVVNSSSKGMIKLMAGDVGTVSGNRTEVSAPLLNYGEPFNPILSANDDKIVWIFTAKQNRSSTGGTQGFNTSNSGLAVVLAADGAHWGTQQGSTATGYAITLLKPTSGNYCVGLARFENGLSNYTILAGNKAENIFSSNTTWFTVKVEYYPDSNEWKLYFRDEMSANDMGSISNTSGLNFIESVVDDTYTNIEMTHFGYALNTPNPGATGSNGNAFFIGNYVVNIGDVAVDDGGNDGGDNIGGSSDAYYNFAGKRILDVDFDNYPDELQNYTTIMAGNDFNGLNSRGAGEIRGLDIPKVWDHKTKVGDSLLRAHFPANIAGGTNCGFLFDKNIPNTEEAIMEYKVKFGEDDFVWAAGGKLPGLGGSTLTGNGSLPVGCTKDQNKILNGFTARLMWRRRGELVLYSYFPERIETGANCGIDYSIAKDIQPGRWYTIRQYIKMNTPGQKDGIMEIYLDGVLAYSNYKVMYRIAGKGNVKINAAIFHTYRGGGATDERFWSPNEEFIWFDDFKVWTKADNEVSLTSPLDNEFYTLGETIDLVADVNLMNVEIEKVVFRINGEDYTQVTAPPYTADFTPVLDGIFLLEAIAFVQDGTTFLSETSSVTVFKPKSPFYGESMPIPGTIEAEEFDHGGEGVSYHDSTRENQGYTLSGVEFRMHEGVDVVLHPENGYVVGWITTGEWLEYTVNVLESGTYNIELHYSSQSGSGTIGIMVNGASILSDINTPATHSWEAFSSIIHEAELNAGEQVWRVIFGQGGLMLDKMIVYEKDDASVMDIIHIQPSITPLTEDYRNLKLNLFTGWDIYTILGVRVLSGYGTDVYMSNLPAGIYVVRFGGLAKKIMIN
jgi:hypothetical protein